MVKKFLRKLLLDESSAIQNNQAQKPLMRFMPVGSYGTESYSGYQDEEYLDTLKRQDRADKFDEMRRSDSNVIMLLSAVKNPIKRATRMIQAVDETPEETKIRDLVEHILFNDMDQTFDEFLSEVLTVIEFGHAFFEITHKVVLNNNQFGNYNGIQCLGWRSPRTIERMNICPHTGKLKSIAQYAFGDLQRLVDIPAEALLKFVLNKEGALYEGISMLRPCYGNYFRKNQYLRLNAAGIEKFAIPTPIVEVPAGQYGSQSYQYLLEALNVYCSHQANYLTVPEGWKFTVNTSPYDPDKVETSIDNEDKRMTKAFLANFLELGQSGGGGSYALGQDLSDFFLSGIEHVAFMIAETINKTLIKEIVNLNFGPRSKYPELHFSGITDKVGVEFAQVIAQLAQNKIITPDDKLEKHVRERYDLPEMSLDGQRTVGAPVPSFPMAEGNRILNRIAERRSKQWRK